MPPVTVLFACVHNAGRSQVAAALFNATADPAAARQQIEVGALVAKKGLSVRETEALVRRMVEHVPGVGKPAPERAPDPNIRKLQDDLADRLGARVQLQHGTAGKGKLVISYNSLDELDGILSHIQ